jgi:DNA mismatch repair protein MutS
MINKILNSNKLLTQIYFDLQKYFESKYPNPLVLMEIGTFFEVYESNGIGKAKEVAELLNIQLTRKNKSIIEVNDKNPLLAGFPNHALDRYIQKLIDEEKYTIILIKQKGIPPKVTRYISDIISPGVNFDYVKKEENYVTSIIIEKIKDIYHIGYANVDITTGKTNIFEAYSTNEDKTFALDELFKLIQTYKSKEFILTLDKSVECDEIINYLELKNINLIYSSKRVKITYQNELLKKVYNIKSLLSPIESLNLESLPLATESFAILLEFIIAHNYKIIQKIDLPKVIENDKYLYFGNNPIVQLDLDDVLKLIDKTSTPMGKRLIKQRFFNPIKDEKELKKRYKAVEFMLKEGDKFENLINEIYDIERLDRKIKLSKLHPFEINYLYSSLENSKRIYILLNKDASKIEEFLFDISQTFDLEKSAKVMFNDIRESVFKKGYSKILDDYSDELAKLNANLELIAKKIESLFEGNVKLNINELDKEGHYLSLTKTRFNLIKDKFNDTFIEIDGNNYFFKDFNIKTLTNSVKITGSIIDEISNEIVIIRQKLINLTSELFLEKLSEFEKKYSFLNELATKIAEVDIALSSAKIAKKYDYSKPIIKNCKLKIKEARHPLIEINQENGIYVPNDVDFNKYDGMLLYGINSSGKSSLMKSIGICVVLAQSGFFVPATKMEFSLFDSIFTRIISKDNLSKGLSTFAVEMIELKNIFKRANSNSLVLGDEISHGTETLSALSIVASAVIKLSKIRANFIFATHLHQLMNLDEIKALKNVVAKHLEVYFDEKSQKLIYNRILQDGSGSSVYGLEFAKSLYMDEEFLKIANEIRKKVTNEYNELELLTKNKKSIYNKDVLVTTCAICGRPADEVHHIKLKSTIENEFQKHHKYNLIPLCKYHHKLAHEGKLDIKGFMMTNEGIQLHYEEKE